MWTLYLDGMWLNVGMRTSTKKTCVCKRLDDMLQHMLTILDSIVNMIKGEGGNMTT